MKPIRPIQLCLFLVAINLPLICFGQNKGAVSPRYNITLREAHIGSLQIDTLLLNSYQPVSYNNKQFYLDARKIFSIKEVDFNNDKIVESAKKNHLNLMAGPMLGGLKEDGITIWLRPSTKFQILIKVNALSSNEEKTFLLKPKSAGVEQRVELYGLTAATEYRYTVLSQNLKIGEGSFTTSAIKGKKSQTRLMFGSGFHKIGLHNPNLINSILKRKPHAMMLLGDLAVDDRDNNFSMHRADYLLRDVSLAWKKLSANIPIYASWDDHDYLNNDLSGVPKGFAEQDRIELRTLWLKNWNNPKNDVKGIYFNTRIGSVELIMLDTRSCRTLNKRGQYGSYLGSAQLKWLKKVLKKSTAPFKVISSGTMWSDDISNGKDSWGTWDTLAREEIFNFLETENISGVLLVSGDRHGARGFKIPRPLGFELYEFEVATLGGVEGPNAMAPNPTNQIFGYHGLGLRAFGEFTFNTEANEPHVTFRLIDEFENILEEHILPYTSLTPKK